MLLSRVAHAATGTSTNGGQITISRPEVEATSGVNFSKNALVSATFLNIFQLPAMTGVLIGVGLENCFLSQYERQSSRPRSGLYRKVTRACPDSRPDASAG